MTEKFAGDYALEALYEGFLDSLKSEAEKRGIEFGERETVLATLFFVGEIDATTFGHYQGRREAIDAVRVAVTRWHGKSALAEFFHEITGEEVSTWTS